MAKVMVIGSGGREHAIGWKLGLSEQVTRVFYAPGNAGTEEGKGKNVPLVAKPANFQAFVDFVRKENVDVVVVGPEAPLADGIVDYFHSQSMRNIFGPTKNASLLESDKFFSYDLMHELRIWQADSVKCCSKEEAIRAIKERTIPDTGSGSFGIVLKARGLTGGKGVSVCDTQAQALEEIEKHSQAYGAEVLVAERLFGQEFSVFGISDGNKVLPLEISVQDHKPLLDGDKGPNTGGMGAYCPAPIAPRHLLRDIGERIMTPVVRFMKKAGAEYRGFLYAGMIMSGSRPKVLEFNIRLGDPETQPLLMMLESDLFIPIESALRGGLDKAEMKFKPGASCCVVLASQGYPGDYKKGLPISGLDEANLPNVKVFHAGTKLDGGRIVTDGGRVLGVTAYSESGISGAQKLAYEAAKRIDIPGGFHYRRDIADKAFR